MILERQVELLILSQMLEAVPETELKDGILELNNGKFVDCIKMSDEQMNL
jgi:hypothetical protein